MASGWVKIHRGLLKWEWFNSPKHLSVFIDLILNANHKDKKYRGTTIKAGSLTTSYKAISNRTGVSIQSVRTVIKDFKLTGEITHVPSKYYSIISITNWDEYQLTNNQNNNLTNNPANNLLTPNKNDNNIINKYIYADVLEKYIEICGADKSARVGLSSKHMKSFLEISENFTLDEWCTAFKNIKLNPTWNGNNSKNWKANLFWLMDPINFSKAYAYESKQVKTLEELEKQPENLDDYSILPKGYVEKVREQQAEWKK